MGLFGKKKKDTSISPFDLDWGEITPDGYNSDEGKALYTFNHFHLSQEARELSRIYSSGRVNWYSIHLPRNSKHHIILDIRGQEEIEFEFDLQKKWADEIRSKISTETTASECEINCLT